MDVEKKIKISTKFITSVPCSEIPELKDCEELRAQFNKEMNSGKGCSSCRKNAVTKKYKEMIIARL